MSPCDYCGKKNDEASDSCAGCGNPLNEQPSDVESPITFASVVCFLSLIFVYCVARNAIELIQIRWAEFLVYAIIPISVTFIILNRSCGHPEITGAARMVPLLLRSCFIFVVVLLVIGAMLCLGFVLFRSFTDGFYS
jgi:hypothetical protein